MPCALCQADTQLCRSHILPEFVHKPLYDNRHRAFVFDYGASDALLLQKGLRESLLCSACETRLHAYEDYFDKKWPRTLPEELASDFNPTFVDYRLLKLFLLSVAWRASVSKLPAFRSYGLGAHERRIRSMLMADEPGPATQYPVLGGLIVDPENGGPFDRLMVGPTKLKVNGHWATRMVFSGVAWTIVTSSHAVGGDIRTLSLRETGELLLFAAPLQEFAGRSGLNDAVANLRLPRLR